VPVNSAELLDFLVKEHLIDMAPGDILRSRPGQLPENFDFDRIEGMLLGLAIGDALGNTNEGMEPEARKNKYGEIRDYLPNHHAGNEKVGLPSDDTQLAFWTLEQILDVDGFNPERLSAKFTSRRIFGIGSTVKEFITNCKHGLPWYKCGPKSAGNGALMRIAPMVIPHLKSATPSLWVDTALSAMMTHNDSASISSCIAFVKIIWETLKMNEAPNPGWWLETYVSVASQLETDRQYRPRRKLHGDFTGTVSEYVTEVIAEGLDRGFSALEACEWWYSGAFLLETVPSVLFILMKHAHDPEEAMVRAVNDTRDNDTIAAIVGAVVGALHGKSRLPERWVSGLPGRTREQDDGKVFELIAAAKKNWVCSKC